MPFAQRGGSVGHSCPVFPRAGRLWRSLRFASPERQVVTQREKAVLGEAVAHQLQDRRVAVAAGTVGEGYRATRLPVGKMQVAVHRAGVQEFDAHQTTVTALREHSGRKELLWV